MVAEESPNCAGVSFWRWEGLFAIRIALHPTDHFLNISRKCKYVSSLVLPSGNYCPREGAEPTPKVWRGGGQRQKESRENQGKFHRGPDKVPGLGGGSISSFK